MIRCLLIIISIFISTSGFSQSGGKIYGTVRTADGKSFASATVELMKNNDSSLVKMASCNSEGKFDFESIKEGDYLLGVSGVGHEKYFSNVIVITSDALLIDLKEIKLLSSSATTLKEVKVASKKPLIEQKMDRMIVNVEAAVSNVGASALEVLEKSPGITVDKDGNISLKGKQGVQIFVDGRPSYLSGVELVNLLRSMNASQLDQIEIMTNPPAKYDAAGNSGIINIKTKKNKQTGFNGSATAGYSQGKYWRTNESLNMNYRNGKFNTFMNFGFNKNNSFQELSIHRTYRKADKSIDALFDQVAFMPKTNTNNNLKLGVDYFANNKTTIGVVTSGFINAEDQRNYNTSFLKNGNGVVDSIVYSTSNMKNRWKNGKVNLNLRHQFDSTGRELTADFDHAIYSSQSDQIFTNTSYNPDESLRGQTDLMGNLPVDIKIYSAKIDYTHPLKSGLKVEAGAKSSYVNTDNAANYFNLISNAWVMDYDKTNQFQYEENISAAYLNLSRQYKKIGIQAGLRFENTNYKGHQLGNVQRADSSFTNKYNSLFPTLYISYKASERHQFGFNTGRRIDRPAYQDLNPFLFFLDNYTYESGNPYMKPQYSMNIEVSHTFKGFLSTTLNYSKTKDFFTETFEQQGYATIVRQGNIGKRQNAGISLSAQVPVFKWWNASLYGNYNFNHFEGELFGEDIKVDASNLLFSVNNQLSFNKGWSAELSGFYRTKGVEGQLVILPLGQLSAGVSKQILQGKGSLRLNVRDIFYTHWAKGRIDFQRTEASFENKRDSRVASISFTYRFGKPINGPQNTRKTGGAEEEQNRVKTGSGN